MAYENVTRIELLRSQLHFTAFYRPLCCAGCAGSFRSIYGYVFKCFSRMRRLWEGVSIVSAYMSNVHISRCTRNGPHMTGGSASINVVLINSHQMRHKTPRKHLRFGQSGVPVPGIGPAVLVNLQLAQHCAVMKTRPRAVFRACGQISPAPFKRPAADKCVRMRFITLWNAHFGWPELIALKRTRVSVATATFSAEGVCLHIWLHIVV